MAETSDRLKRNAATEDKRRLFVDLEVCAKCPECVTKCGYFYHPGNNGMVSVREMAALSVVCRRCQNPVCISACPREALEREETGVVRRYKMRCVGCKSCSVACPFGTLLPEAVPYAVSVCDYCAGAVQKGEVPVCVTSCPLSAVQFSEAEEDISKNNYAAGERLVVHALPWKKEEVRG